MVCVYPEMEYMILKRGIKKKTIASRLGISERCLYNKLKGKAAFTWPEIEVLQKDFFPDMTKEDLLKQTDKQET